MTEPRWLRPRCGRFVTEPQTGTVTDIMGRALWSTTARAGLAAAAMAIPLAWAATTVADSAAGGQALLVGAGGLAIGALIYLAGAFLLRMPEIQIVRHMATRR